MARGLVRCFHGATPSIHLSSFPSSRVSLVISSYMSTQSLDLPRRFRCNPRRFVHSLRKFAPVTETFDVGKYEEGFERRMAMAGLKPQHSIALGVSGGPDSIALCVLAANWKTSSSNRVGYSNGYIDGLLAVIVDHGLRPESREEAETVSHRVSRMGIRCEIACCEWINGKPKQGHLQEAAREKRYQTLQNVCFRNQIGVLLVAHHADDQAELFVLRLSRDSGVLGLAGMPFASEMFSSKMQFLNNHFRNSSLLLVRPLLDFWKEDMYKICEWGNQEWVEDPTNRNQVFARNRIRYSIGNLSQGTFKSEVQAVVSACRKTRLSVDQACSDLINRAVTIADQGYAILDLHNLDLSEVSDICLSKFLALILQFISQRLRPVRGSTSKLVLNYIRTFPCKTSLTAAGCYLCPAPRSKGTKILVCCSVDCPLPSDTDTFLLNANTDQNHKTPYELEQIIADGKSFADQLVPTVSKVAFLDESSETVLSRARQLGLLSEATYDEVIRLQTEEKTRFRSKKDQRSDIEPDRNADAASTSDGTHIRPGQVCCFMNRFLVSWKLSNQSRADCECCHENAAYVRHMVESDWLYLSDLLKNKSSETGLSSSDFLKLSAQRAVVCLKSVPVAARRSLPVLVNQDGVLLSIPTIGFRNCPCIEASACFSPRVPLGGGHSSYI